jgi:hypothetical protein
LSDRKRTPRAHLSSEAIGEDHGVRIPVSPLLVEHLRETFPVRLSPRLVGHAREDIITDQAELRGQQEVIDYLHRISSNQEA